MAVTIKSAREIELMREAGKILAVVHDEMAKALRPGMSTMDINRVGEQVIRDLHHSGSCGGRQTTPGHCRGL